MQNNYISNLLNLKGVNLNKVEQNHKEILVFIDTTAHEQTCPCCHNKTSKIHDYRTQKIKTINIGVKSVIIVLNKRRYACKCGKRFYEKYDFLPKYYRMTTDLVSYIINLATNLMCLKQIAKFANVSSTTVARIIDKISYGKPDIGETLAIDEFKGNAETGKFQCILVDPKNKKILDILPKRNTPYLTNYFKSIPKEKRFKVKFFVCDMWKPYVKLAKIFFPKAKIIIDRYHFVRQVMWALEKVRKRLQKTMPANLRKYYKRSKRLLTKRYSKLKEDEKQAVDLMLLYNEELRFAHYLKEDFIKLCHEQNFETKKKDFADWIYWAEKSEIKEFIKCAATYRNWYNEILNALKYKYSNGCTEGFNNKIKVIKRVSFGIMKFSRLRTRILHCQNQ